GLQQNLQNRDLPYHDDPPLRRLQAVEQVVHRIAKHRNLNVTLDLLKKPITLQRNALERELEEGCQIVISGSDLRQNIEVSVLLLMVVVRHCDERRVAKLGSLQEKRFQCARGPSIAIEKRVHRRKVVMQCHGLNERIVAAEFALHRTDQGRKGL